MLPHPYLLHKGGHILEACIFWKITTCVYKGICENIEVISLMHLYTIDFNSLLISLKSVESGMNYKVLNLKQMHTCVLAK